MFPKLRYSAEQIHDYCQLVSTDMVTQSLSKSRCDYFDLLNLLSPAASREIPALRRQATWCRRRHFGKTVSVYAPLYVANTCVNSCKYCDFNIHQQAHRKILTTAEVRRECAAIRQSGIESLLLVAGEDPRHVSVDFFCAVGTVLRDYFSYLALEVAPQSDEGYRRLFAAGFDGVTCYQETYDQDLYRELHPSGPKRDYEFRLWTQLRAGRAGFRSLGLGFLLGLAPWLLDAASLGAHALFLMRECYRSKIQFSFPRITPISDGFQPAHPVGEDELEQMMLAFRIVFPECGITVSTREAPGFRDGVVLSCADNMSAGSRVTPGGYAVQAEHDLAQFTLNDTRVPLDVFKAIRENGQEVVFKTWDKRI